MFNLKKVKRLENELNAMTEKANSLNNQVLSLVETSSNLRKAVDSFNEIIMRTGVFRNKKGQMQKIRNISDVR